MVRAFFALSTDHNLAEKIANWRKNALPPLSHPVPATNYHVTLAFLGNLTLAQCDQAARVLETLDYAAFRLTLKTVGFWAQNNILWLGPDGVPAVLTEIQRTIVSQSRRSGLKIEDRAFTPHITLARRCETAPPEPLIAPQFVMNCEEICLFESVRGKSGVRYEPIAGLVLRPAD